ncbi:MAG: 50S ribosomal protein L30 [Candidatus Dormibacteria bacterium]
MSDATIRIKYTKSAIGYPKNQKATVAALGLRKLNQVVEHVDNPQIRGMVHTVQHLVTLETAAGGKDGNNK